MRPSASNLLLGQLAMGENGSNGAQADEREPTMLKKSTNRMKQLAACCLCMITGPVLIFINKHLLSTVGFRFPAQLTSNGVACSTAYAFLAVHAFGVKTDNRDKVTRSVFLTKILPVGLCQMLTFVTGKAAYLYLGVAYIQVSRENSWKRAIFAASDLPPLLAVMADAKRRDNNHCNVP